MNNRGTFEEAAALIRSGQLEATVVQWEQELEVPALWERLFAFGEASAGLGRCHESLKLHTKALALDPKNVRSLCALGEAYESCARSKEAHECFLKALELAPEEAMAWSGIGYTLLRLGKLQESFACLQRALSYDAMSVDVSNRMGLCLLAQKRFPECIALFEKSVDSKPDFVVGWKNLAVARRSMGEIELAILACSKALEIQSADAGNWTNMGVLLQEQNRVDEAIAAYQKAIQLDRSYHLAHLNEGLAHLLRGNLLLGALKYEYRWLVVGQTPARHGALLFWRGSEPLAGKVILLHADQGFGDTMQFLRYAGILAKMGATVHVEVHPCLVDLVKQVDGVSSVVKFGEKVGHFDFHCPFLSLPFACRTTLEAIPRDVPYIKPSLMALDKWRPFWTFTNQPRVALVWRGNPEHDNDQNRSCALDFFQPLLESCHCEFVNLQWASTAEEKNLLGRCTNFRDPTPHLTNFDDTAAVIAGVDLVISVDTAVAHLAGAMGKPVWILLPFAPDWRWMLKRNDSPWYPTARLFRQPRRKEWAELMPQVLEALIEFCALKSASQELPVQ